MVTTQSGVPVTPWVCIIFIIIQRKKERKKEREMWIFIKTFVVYIPGLIGNKYGNLNIIVKYGSI